MFPSQDQTKDIFYNVSAAIILHVRTAGRLQFFLWFLLCRLLQTRISKLSQVRMRILVCIAFVSSCNGKHWTHQITDGTRFPSRNDRPIAALSFIPWFPSSVHRCHLDPQSNESTCGKIFIKLRSPLFYLLLQWKFTGKTRHAMGV